MGPHHQKWVASLAAMLDHRSRPWLNYHSRGNSNSIIKGQVKWRPTCQQAPAVIYEAAAPAGLLRFSWVPTSGLPGNSSGPQLWWQHAPQQHQQHHCGSRPCRNTQGMVQPRSPVDSSKGSSRSAAEPGAPVQAHSGGAAAAAGAQCSMATL